MASTAVEVTIALLAKDAASGVLQNVTTKFQGLGAAAKVATAVVAAAATAVVGTVTALTALAVKSAAAAGEVAKLKRETGLTAEEASKFRVIGERFGLTVDDLSKSFGIFSKNIDNNAKAIADNHVVVVKAKDGHVDMEKTLGLLADRFKNMPDGVEKTSLAMEVFGRSGKDMIPFLNQGKDGLKALGDEAARMGLVFDDKALAAAKRFGLAQKDLSENIEGLKNKIGMAFLPILADASQAMLGLANAVLPYVSAGFDKVSGFVRTAILIFNDMKKAADFTMVGGGDALGSLIGPVAAKNFMGLIRTVSAEWQSLWIIHIRPAITWAQANIPQFWENVKTVIAAFWAAAKPKLDEFVKTLDLMKEKFDKLPPVVQHWAEATAVGVVAVKATGLDDIIQGWANSLGNFVGGAAGGVTALKALGVAAATMVAGFAILTLAIGAVIYIGTHLDDLATAWTQLSLLFKLQFAQVADFIVNAWRLTVMTFVNGINGMIDGINKLIEGMNHIPGVQIPLISHLHIDLPNANNVENALNEIARNRTSTITIYTNTAPGGGGNARPQAAGGDYMVGPSYGGPKLFWAGEAGDERATFTPVGKTPAGGGGTVINIYADVVDAQALDRFADKIGGRFTQQRRMQGLA